MDKTGSGGLIVLANVRFRDLRNIITFIYHGEVKVSNSDLNSFLRTANDLKIEGLVGETVSIFRRNFKIFIVIIINAQLMSRIK